MLKSSVKHLLRDIWAEEAVYDQKLLSQNWYTDLNILFTL
jgi:hypothetical protein